MGGGAYRDMHGLRSVATPADSQPQDWSLNPGRSVGVAEREEDELDVAERLPALHEGWSF